MRIAGLNNSAMDSTYLKRRLTLPQLKEYDITQKIIETVANVCSRSVLFSILTEAKDATQIADELKLSISNVYKTLAHLEDLALVNVDTFKISEEGKKIKMYKSRIAGVEIKIKGIEPVLNLYPNNGQESNSR